jgi:hypothetical protein
MGEWRGKMMVPRKVSRLVLRKASKLLMEPEILLGWVTTKVI